MTVMFYMQQGYDFFQDVAITNWIFFFVFFVHVCYVFFLNTHKLFKLDKLHLVKSPWVHEGEEVMDANRIPSTSSKASREISSITILGCSVQLQYTEVLLASKELLSMRVSAAVADSSLTT